MGCGNVELKSCSPSLSRENLNTAQGSLRLVVRADHYVWTELQDLVKMWEPHRVPPHQCAAQDHLEMLPVHTKPVGYVPEYWVFCFLIEA